MDFLEAIYLANLKMGWVVIFLFLIGFVGWIYILGLGYFYYRQRKSEDIDKDQLKQFIKQRLFPKKKDKSINNYYAYRIYLQHTRKTIDKRHLELFKHDYELQVTNKLMSIKVMASVSPLLGLLGTINGIIQVFVIILREGSANAILLSDGISQALLTTEAGLVISIPLIFMYTILKNEHNKVIGKMKQLESAVEH